jgi:hypothetical protein
MPPSKLASAEHRSADLAQPRRYQIAQNARPITPAARTTSPSLTSRTVMVAGDEERTLSVSGAVPPGLAASRRLVAPTARLAGARYVARICTRERGA